MQPSCAVSLFARIACRVESFAIADPLRLLCTHWIRYRASNLWNLEKNKMHKTHCFLKVVFVCNYEHARLLCRYLAISICIRPTHFCPHQFCPSLRWSSSCIPQLWCKTRCFQANVLQHFGSERWRSCGHPEGKSNETSPLAHCTSIAPMISLHIYFGCFP